MERDGGLFQEPLTGLAPGTQSILANHRAVSPVPPEGASVVYSDYTITKYAAKCVWFFPVRLIYLILLYLNYESVKLGLNIYT